MPQHNTHGNHDNQYYVAFPRNKGEYTSLPGKRDKPFDVLLCQFKKAKMMDWHGNKKTGNVIKVFSLT